MPDGQSAPHEALSNREFQVLELLAAGVSVTDGAAKLNLSVKTVSTHKANLMHKLGLNNQCELIRYALRHGLLDTLAP
jgi:DNA-binding NarL/FixJ family response regulator